MNARALPIIQADYNMCHCQVCSLQERRAKTYCPSFIPERFNGLMIIGEGPGENEARLKVPFVGRAGELLDYTLRAAGIERTECFLSNATACFPPPRGRDKNGKELSFEDAHPYAVPACRPRLMAEIEAARPRVILALGNPALLTLTGNWRERISREPRFKNPDGTVASCPTCRGAMTLPFWECAQCEAVNYLPDGFSSYAGQPIGTQLCGRCAQPNAAVLGKRKKRCPQCEGKKTVEQSTWRWKMPYRISQVAGTVFRGREAADVARMAPEACIDLPIAYMIPSFHPASILRQPDKKKKAQKMIGGQFLWNAQLAHFKKAARLLKEDAWWPFNYGIIYGGQDEPVATPEELWRILRRAQYEPVDIDIEADDKDPWRVTKITCIGFHAPYEHGTRAITVNTDGRHPSTDPILRDIATWLTAEGYKKSLQHGIYDVQTLWRLWGVEVNGWSFDTQVAHNAIVSDAPHDLQHLAGCYTDTPPWKPPKEEKGKLVHESSAAQRVYNARDCFNTTGARRALELELDHEKAQFVHDLDLAMFKCAREMERVGLPIDRERWQTWRDKATFYRDRATEVLCKFAGRSDFNPNSAPQLQWFLYDKSGPCRLIPQKYTPASPKHPRGQPSTDKTALLAFKGHEAVDALLDARRWGYTLSTNMKEIVVYQDWRLRVQWNPIGARTGRWTTKGLNAQNWFKTILVNIREGQIHPADAHLLERPDERWLRIPGIREVVKAPPGRKIVGADSSQAEIRALAALSGEVTLIEILARGDAMSAELKRRGDKAGAKLLKYDPHYDVHSHIAAKAFGDAYLQADPRTKHGLEVRDRLRDLVKRVIYGMNYGAGADTILEAIYDGGYEGPPITEQDIVKLMNTYFAEFPRIRAWREEIAAQARKTGRIWDALIGRRREFPLGTPPYNLLPITEAYNFAIQASCASMINMAMWEFYQALAGVDPTARLLAQVHDAIYCECAEDKAEAVAALLERCMSQELRLVEGAPYMPFPASAKIADDWYQAG